MLGQSASKPFMHHNQTVTPGQQHHCLIHSRQQPGCTMSSSALRHVQMSLQLQYII